MPHGCPRPRMRWNGAIGAIARGKKVSTVCAPKSRARHALRLIGGETPGARGVATLFTPYMRPGQDESNPVSLLQCLNVGFSYIGNFFTNALVNKDQARAYLFVGVYFGGFLLGIPIVALYGYMQDYLGLRWRDWLTNDFVGKYFQGRTYYDIEITAEIDNPDQRISEDIRTFTRVTLTFLLVI